MKTSRQRWQLAFRCLVTAAVVLGIVLLARTLDGDRLKAALTKAAPLPLLAGAALSFAILTTKSLAWQQLLAPAYAPPRRALLRITLLSYAVSSLVPLRGGEVLRVLLLQRDHHVPPGRAAIIATVEKMLDVVAILLLASPLLWVGATLPASIGWISVGAGLAAVLILAALVRWVQRSATPVRSAHLFKAFGILAVGWFCECAAIACVMLATGVAATPTTVLLALLGINFAVALPSTPGQVGALQLGAVGALRLVGVPSEAALGFAVLYQAVQLLPIIGVGLLLDHRLMFGNWPMPSLGRSRDQVQL